MATQNPQDRYIWGASVEIATVSSWSVVLPALTWANYDSNRAILEWLTYNTIIWTQNLNITHTRTNEQVLELDNCGAGTASRVYTPITTINFDWFNTWDQDIRSDFYDFVQQSVAGTPDTDSQSVTSWTRQFNTPIKLRNQNADLSQITPSTVTFSVDWVIATDLVFWKDANGESTLTVIGSWWAITTEAQDITIDYSFTPATSTLTGYEGKAYETPFKIYRITSCPNEAGESDVFYIYKASITSDVSEVFTNLCRDWQGFESTSITITGEKWQQFIRDKQTLTDLNS